MPVNIDGTAVILALLALAGTIVTALARGSGGGAKRTQPKESTTGAHLAMLDMERKLRQALDADEAGFRHTVYEAWRAAVAENRELSGRLTTVIGQLTVITLERDRLRVELTAAQEGSTALRQELTATKAELAGAKDRIGELESQVAELRRQLQSGGAGAPHEYSGGG